MPVDVINHLGTWARRAELMMAVVALATERVNEFFKMSAADQRTFVDNFDGDKEYEGHTPDAVRDHFSRQIAGDLCCKWYTANVVREELPPPPIDDNECECLYKFVGATDVEMLDAVLDKLALDFARVVCFRPVKRGDTEDILLDESAARALTASVREALDAQRGYFELTRGFVEECKGVGVGMGGHSGGGGWEFSREEKFEEALAKALRYMVHNVLMLEGNVRPSQIEWKILTKIVSSAVQMIYDIETLEIAPAVALLHGLNKSLTQAPPGTPILASLQANATYVDTKFTSTAVLHAYAMYAMVHHAQQQQPNDIGSFRAFLVRSLGLPSVESKAPVALLRSSLRGPKEHGMLREYKVALTEFVMFGTE